LADMTENGMACQIGREAQGRALSFRGAIISKGPDLPILIAALLLAGI